MSAPTAPSSNVVGFDPVHPVRKGEPAWDIALLFPFQGNWTESDYLALDTNRPIELSDGCLEFLPMRTPFHQRIAQYLFRLLETWVISRGLGEVFTSPLRIRLWNEKIRLPDVVFVRPGRVADVHQPPDGADLAMEVVSPGKDNEVRDYEVKRREYAKAGVQEYWIVDPQAQCITVLALDGNAYREIGKFPAGTIAKSQLLPGFSLDVSAVFAAGLGSAGHK